MPVVGVTAKALALPEECDRVVFWEGSVGWPFVAGGSVEYSSS